MVLNRLDIVPPCATSIKHQQERTSVRITPHFQISDNSYSSLQSSLICINFMHPIEHFSQIQYIIIIIAGLYIYR